MNNFNYYTPTKVFFGKGEELKLGEIIKSYGFKKVLFHYGQSSIKKSGLYDTVINQLKASKIAYIELGGVEANPKLSLVLKGVEMAKKEHVDMILAVGGGSVLDSAKSISAGAKVDFSPWKFSIKEEEVKDHIPVGAILTLSASGSDMSNSCVITNDETLEKRGFSSDFNRPLFAILNPELTYTVNKWQTACGVVDIMMHTLERYFSNGDDKEELTDNLALGLLKAVYDAGKVVMADSKNYDARATLMWANSLSHNGLTGCGKVYFMAVHQMEHEISGMYDNVSHGAGLAVLWPQWAMNSYKASPKRFLRLAYEVMGVVKTGNDEQDIITGIQKMKEYFKWLGMPTTLRELGVKKESLEDLAWNAMFKGKRVLPDIVTVDKKLALKILEESY